MRPHTIVWILLAMSTLMCAQNPPISREPSPDRQQQRCEDNGPAPAHWEEFNGTDLTVASSGNSAYSRWQVTFDESSRDLQLQVDLSDHGKVQTGRVLMIGSRVLAAKGEVIEPGKELDVLQMGVLKVQLLKHVLAFAVPDGPVSVKSVQDLNYSSRDTAIDLHTTGAGATFGPPWRVTGKIQPAECGAIRFDLSFAWAGSGETKYKREKVQLLKGRLFSSDKASIADSFSLQSWRVFRDWALSAKNPRGRETGPLAYNSVAEVREQMRKNELPKE